MTRAVQLHVKKKLIVTQDAGNSKASECNSDGV